MILAAAALAAETTLTLAGEVPDDGLDHFFLPFEVPEGTVEIEVRHDDLSDANVLDWGVDDPAGFRGWGGGNDEPAVIGVEAASRSYVPGPLPAGTWRVVVGKAKIGSPPGEYHVEIALRDTATLAPEPEREPYADVPALSGEGRWYAGDLHVHSRDSGDARPSLDEIAAYAVAAGLDFVVITDHDTNAQLDFFADAQARRPELLLVPGVEFTTYDGHFNGIGATAWVDHRIGQPGVTIEAAAEAFHAQGALVSVNHPTVDLGDACIGCAWDHALDPGEIDAMEILTGGWEPVGGLFAPSAMALWEEWLDAGARIAPVGGSDDHRAGVDEGATGSPIGSPTTMVWAEELSVPALLAGLRAGHTVVKTQSAADPMVVLDGDTITVEGGDGARLEIVEDGEVVETMAVTGDPFETSWSPTGSRVRAQLLVGGDLRVVTAYRWVDEEAPPAEAPACGCGGGSSALLAPLWLAARRGRRRASAS
ncbi:MAG: CehA/McbA family metallohydrolase [Myxococcota bacterium]